MKAKNGRMFNVQCGAAKIKDQEGNDLWVVFGKQWDCEDTCGGVLGKGDTEVDAMEDAIVRLLDFKRKSVSVQDAIKRVERILEQSTGGHNYESVLPWKYECDSKEHECDNVDIIFDDECEEFSICLS